MKAECTFLLLNLLMIGLYNSSDYSWFEIFSFLIPLSGADLTAWKGDFLSNIFKPWKLDSFDIRHIWRF